MTSISLLTGNVMLLILSFVMVILASSYCPQKDFIFGRSARIC